MHFPKGSVGSTLATMMVAVVAVGYAWATLIAITVPAAAEGDFGASAMREYYQTLLAITVGGATIAVIIMVALEVAESLKVLSRVAADRIWAVGGVLSLVALLVGAFWTNEFRLLLVGMLVSAIAFQVTSAIRRFKGPTRVL
jgi:hypothetical protein